MPQKQSSDNRSKFETHIEVSSIAVADEPLKIVDLLSRETGLTKPVIKTAMNKGAVWLTSEQGTRRIRRAGKTAGKGEEIHLYYDQKVLKQEPEPATLIVDEGDYSLWYKPYGIFCQGSKWGDHCTINRWVETHHRPQKPAFIVHRLDRAATGLILLAHKKKTAAYFSKLFETRAIEKSYQAIVYGQFPESLIMDSEIDGKAAFTEARLLEYSESLDCSRLDIIIETGRKHQIRRHLSQAGFSIKGDRLYGNYPGKADEVVDLCLTSCYLSFTCHQTQSTKAFRLPAELMPKLV